MDGPSMCCNCLGFLLILELIGCNSHVIGFQLILSGIESSLFEFFYFIE